MEMEEQAPVGVAGAIQQQHKVYCRMPGFSKLTLFPKAYPSKVLGRLDTLRGEGTLCDCTLMAEGREFPVHKCFLSACSPYFKALFTSPLKERGRKSIEIRGVSAETLEIVLDFAYRGAVSLTEENITDVYPAAELLQVAELRDVCCDYFLNQLCTSNCLGIWRYARNYCSAKLEASAWCYISKNFKEVVAASEEFKGLSKEELCTILAANDLSLETEMDAHTAVLTWMLHDLEKRKQHLVEVFSQVRLPLLSTQALSSLVATSELVSIDKSSKDVLVQARNAQRLRSTKSRQQKAPVFKQLSLTPRKSSKKLVVVGGYCGGFVEQCESLSDEVDSWKDNDLSLSSKELYWVGVIGMRLYALGGDSVTNINQILSRFTADAADLLYSDAFTADWEIEATLPHDCSGSQVCIMDECIYTLGEAFLDNTPVYGISCYDPNSGTWEFLTVLRQSRVSAGFAAHEGKLYLAGGMDPLSGAVVTSLEAFNPATRTWEVFPSCRIGRYHAGAAILNTKLYLIGGIGDPGGEINVLLDSVECFSLETKEWSDVCSLQAPRAGMAVCAWKGRVYAIGGECSEKNHSAVVESYDGEENVWAVLPSMGNERIYPNVVLL